MVLKLVYTLCSLEYLTPNYLWDRFGRRLGLNRIATVRECIASPYQDTSVLLNSSLKLYVFIFFNLTLQCDKAQHGVRILIPLHGYTVGCPLDDMTSVSQ